MAPESSGSILLISDLHAHYHVVDAQVTHAEEALGRTVEQVLVLGDFGLFPSNLHDYFRRRSQTFRRPVAYIEGNHEDFRNLDRLTDDYADIMTYLPRASRRTFGPWRCLSLGGAQYMDAWSTPPGCEIRQSDIEACLENEPGSVDIVITHDCPAGIGVSQSAGFEHLGPPGVEGLTRIAEHLRPRFWFFGHHHRWYEAERMGTRFLGLPEAWQGYVLLDGSGAGDCLERVEHEVRLPRRPRWWRFIGLK